jgi:DNA-binding IclR family transcriptional regulator
MTSLESEVLDALRPGGMLTLNAIAKATGRPKWLVRRAADSLRRQSLVWENRRSQWQAYRGGWA